MVRSGWPCRTFLYIASAYTFCTQPAKRICTSEIRVSSASMFPTVRISSRTGRNSTTPVFTPMLCIRCGLSARPLKHWAKSLAIGAIVAGASAWFTVYPAEGAVFADWVLSVYLAIPGWVWVWGGLLAALKAYSIFVDWQDWRLRSARQAKLARDARVSYR